MTREHVSSQGLKQHVLEKVDGTSSRLVQISKALHANPEIGLQEYESSKTLASELERNGFRVEKPLVGIQTAFRAVFDGQKGGPARAMTLLASTQ